MKERRKGSRKEKMQALRLTKREQRELHLKWLKINRELVLNNGVPMNESELLHAVIRMALPMIGINKDNQLVLGNERTGDLER